MYEEFFGLSEKPFSKTPDPRFLYESKQHREALARLEYACEERDIALLTGEIGAGKTLLSRALIDRLSERFEVALIINPRLTPRELLANLCQKLNIPAHHRRSEMAEKIGEYLVRLHENSKSLVLILDEAQLIPSKSTFDELRLLTNFQMDDTNLLSIIIIGQPEIRRRLEHSAYKALMQRVGLRYHLAPFENEDTHFYVRHRLRVAGGSEDIFSQGALNVLHDGSGGVPRLINTFAHSALIEAFGREEKPVSADAVKNALSDFKTYGQPEVQTQNHRIIKKWSTL